MRTILLILVLLMPSVGVAVQVVDLMPRKGMTLRTLVITPESPKAAVILFLGGSGRPKITKAGRVKSKNFLVRSRNLFVKNGLAAIVPDAPSDHYNSDGMKGWFRETKEHTADLKALIKFARDRFKVPVWLVGTSRGTNSVANGGTKIF